ncbi:hypothetical protein SteCoe_27439 [Stentor coeruleus]|uniref:Uncharacterized protein n=1 Tax=Stentor coeruleus TaxID=5963 RepID=A0A1R2BAL7_9CILI|nr:hypothetical protein SteCoe_27439 [Stentor coeruleus]
MLTRLRLFSFLAVGFNIAAAKVVFVTLFKRRKDDAWMDPISSYSDLPTDQEIQKFGKFVIEKELQLEVGN